MIPGRAWRVARRCTQVLGLLVVFGAPFLGGWQRLEREELSSWDARGWDLPTSLQEALPRGDAPAQAYASNQALGGGLAVSVADLSVVDPVAGAVAMAAGPFNWGSALAWLLPLGFAFVFGRWFCGWLCPYGTVARALERLLAWLPRRPPRLALPARRPVRWILMGALLVFGLAGSQVGVTLVLPHLALQQAAYGMWLMGGLGAAAGWLFALMAVGLAFGPTAWCAAVCPTGAALSLPARGGPKLRLRALDTTSCGRRCDLCARACWLQLDPGSGDPGPDCDLCGRCVPVCPTGNLGVRKSAVSQHARVVLFLLLMPAMALAQAEPRPRLILSAEQHLNGLHAVIELVDLSAVRLDADDRRAEGGAELTFFAARGDLGPPDEWGKLPGRDTYGGGLQVSVRDRGGVETPVGAVAGPNWPQSTGRRGLYRLRLPELPAPGEVLVLRLEGEPGVTTWPIPAPTPAGPARVLKAFGVGLLVAAGLSLLALAAGPARGRVDRRRT
jgi:ferredoxin